MQKYTLIIQVEVQNWNFKILGLQADEIHLCGEAGALHLIEEICNTTGEELEVCPYIITFSITLYKHLNKLLEYDVN